MAVGWGRGEKERHLHFLYTKQFYHCSSNLNQLDEVRKWEKRKKRWEFYAFHYQYYLLTFKQFLSLDPLNFRSHYSQLFGAILSDSFPVYGVKMQDSNCLYKYQRFKRKIEKDKSPPASSNQDSFLHARHQRKKRKRVQYLALSLGPANS